MYEIKHKLQICHLIVEMIFFSILLGSTPNSQLFPQVLSSIEYRKCGTLTSINVDSVSSQTYVALAYDDKMELSIYDMKTDNPKKQSILKTDWSLDYMSIISAPKGGAFVFSIYHGGGPIAYTILDSNLQIIDGRRMKSPTGIQIFHAPDGNPVLASSSDESNHIDVAFGLPAIYNENGYRLYTFRTNPLPPDLGGARSYYMPNDSTILVFGLEFTKEDALKKPRSYNTDHYIIAEINSYDDELVREWTIDVDDQRIMKIPGYSADGTRIIPMDDGQYLLLFSARNHDEIKILQLNQRMELVDLPEVLVKNDYELDSHDTDSLQLTCCWYAFNTWDQVNHTYPLNGYAIYIGPDRVLLSVRSIDCRRGGEN